MLLERIYVYGAMFVSASAVLGFFYWRFREFRRTRKDFQNVMYQGNNRP